MKVGLFIPCYIDAIYPEVGIATLELLEKSGVEVYYPLDQICCGKPLTNQGDMEDSKAAQELFMNNFKGCEYIVCPAGSCVSEVRYNYDSIEQTKEVKYLRENTYELVEFLHDILKKRSFPGIKFPHKVALHNSCTSIRKLNIAKPSESVGKPFNKSADLLNKIEGLQLVELKRPDECCGFGGSFCITNEEVSARMGCDKVADYLSSGAEYIVSPDMSCLMHQQNVAQKGEIERLLFLHIAQVLNGGPFKR